MPIDLKTLFQQKQDSEILAITPKEREEFLKQAELFIHKNFASKSTTDGGDLSEINSAMARSLLEFFARDKALACKSGPIPKIDSATYDNALVSFKEYLSKTFESYDLLRYYWFSQVKLCISNAFSNSKKIFRTYVIGDLCETLHLSNKLADTVLTELEEEQFVKVIGKQYGEDILIRPI